MEYSNQVLIQLSQSRRTNMNKIKLRNLVSRRAKATGSNARIPFYYVGYSATEMAEETSRDCWILDLLDHFIVKIDK